MGNEARLSVLTPRPLRTVRPHYGLLLAELEVLGMESCYCTIKMMMVVPPADQDGPRDSS